MKYKILLTILLSVLTTTNVLAKDLIIFTASWCDPCKNLKKFISDNSTAKEYKELQILDIEKHQDEARKLGITKVPTSIIFDDEGKLQSKKVGFSGSRSYDDWLQQNL